MKWPGVARRAGSVGVVAAVSVPGAARMIKPNAAWAEIEAQWRECFGEPPPIRASISLMRKVIRAAQADGYPHVHARDAALPAGFGAGLSPRC